MEVFFFTFRSVTSAMRAQELLAEASLRADVVRTPTALRGQGCGYSLRVRRDDFERVLALLRNEALPFRRIYRRRGTEPWREVRP